MEPEAEGKILFVFCGVARNSHSLAIFLFLAVAKQCTSFVILIEVVVSS